MSCTTGTNGRLCNQVIRNLAVSIMAEKFNLTVNYSSLDRITSLGIPLFNGEKSYESTMTLADENYFSTYNSESLESNVDPNNSYFQSYDMAVFIYKHLHKEDVKASIMNANPFANRYNANNDIFIHIRLDDVERFNPGLNYYLHAIRDVVGETTEMDGTMDDERGVSDETDNGSRKIYISSDGPHHSIVQDILAKYSNAELLNYNEVQTIQFGSTCKHVILSHGSFSAVIAYLSFFSNVMYPEYEPGKIWYGDLLSIEVEGWKRCNSHLVNH